MRTVCVINNYNYATYIEECIMSAVEQTYSFDTIYIIDDGSTDHSRPIISALLPKYKNIKTIFKENGGQLSCFNAVANLIDPTDFVCFLDADDVLPTDYLSLLMPKHQVISADLYFCEPTHFASPASPPRTALRTSSYPDFNWRISSHTARARRTWTGSPTSCISLTGALFQQLLPYPFADDWRTRADDIFIYGSAIVGASKCYLPSLTIGYRVHGANSFYGREQDGAMGLQYELKIERLFNSYCDKFLLTQDPARLDDPARREIALVPSHLRARFHLPSNEELTLQNYRGAKRTFKKLRLRLRGIR
jgi:glycosyltransferase involved in cell wall biosynthesis